MQEHRGPHAVHQYPCKQGSWPPASDSHDHTWEEQQLACAWKALQDQDGAAKVADKSREAFKEVGNRHSLGSLLDAVDVGLLVRQMELAALRAKCETQLIGLASSSKPRNVPA